MKLTKVIRDAFVRAAMDDVPSIDYDEKIRSAAMVDAVGSLPPAVQKVWRNRETRHFIKTHWQTHGGVSMSLPGQNGTLSREVAEVVAELAVLKDKQSDDRKALRQKLSAAAESCTTRKALAELLPEFEKYLPADQCAAIKTLPAVANIVADFTRAGWPKGCAK